MIQAMALTLGFCAAAAVDGGARAESVDLELVLLADASGSIDDAEIHFQRQGYASAITHPAVLDAIAQGYDQRIAVTYVEWGGVSSQEVVVPWTIVDGPASAASFAAALLAEHAAEHGQRHLGADAADAVDEQLEEVALILGGEAVERVLALRHIQVREQLHLASGRARHPVIGAERHEAGVADAVALDDELVREGFDELAAQVGDHGGTGDWKLEIGNWKLEIGGRGCRRQGWIRG
jgi:hypothetical protein